MKIFSQKKCGQKFLSKNKLGPGKGFGLEIDWSKNDFAWKKYVQKSCYYEMISQKSILVKII